MQPASGVNNLTTGLGSKSSPAAACAVGEHHRALVALNKFLGHLKLDGKRALLRRLAQQLSRSSRRF